MAEFISGVMQKQLGGNAAGMEKQSQATQNGGRSFESVMQKNNSPVSGDSVGQVGKANDPKLESMRADLMQRYQNLPEGVPKTTAIFPEFLDTKSRMSSFKTILNQAIGSNGNNPQATDIKGRFSQVENEWRNLDTAMRSDKDMSQGEMLGMQARLYQVSQHLDMLSKVVDQMTSGVKTLLNTNV